MTIGSASAPACCTASQKSRRRISARPRSEPPERQRRLAEEAGHVRGLRPTTAVAPAPSRVSRPPGGGRRRSSARAPRRKAHQPHRTLGQAARLELQPLRLRQLGRTCIKKLGRSESQSPRAAASKRSQLPGRAARRLPAIGGQPRRPLLDHPVAGQAAAPGSAPWSTDSPPSVRGHSRQSAPVVNLPPSLPPSAREPAFATRPLVTPAKRRTHLALAVSIAAASCARWPPAGIAPSGVHLMRRLSGWVVPMLLLRACAGAADGDEPHGAGEPAAWRNVRSRPS